MPTVITSESTVTMSEWTVRGNIFVSMWEKTHVVQVHRTSWFHFKTDKHCTFHYGRKEQLRNIRAERHSKYLKSKQSKDAIPEKPLEKTPISVTPATEDHLQSNDTPTKWPEGTICLAGHSILNGTDGSLLSQKQLVKVRQFPGATIADIYANLEQF